MANVIYIHLRESPATSRGKTNCDPPLPWVWYEKYNRLVETNVIELLTWKLKTIKSLIMIITHERHGISMINSTVYSTVSRLATKKTPKFRNTGSLWGETTSDGWIHPTKDQECRMLFYAMKWSFRGITENSDVSCGLNDWLIYWGMVKAYMRQCS